MMYKYLCFIKQNNKILMLNRKYPPHMGLWNGIGGKIDAGETPLQCVVREAYEETGIKLNNVSCAGKVTWITPKGNSGMYVFVAEVPESFEYATPVIVEEGLLDWKDITWILDSKNSGITANIQDFLPSMLQDSNIYDHQFTFNDDNKITDYTRVRFHEVIGAV
jgi:8-oxo-dGTP diphosphatase